MINDAFIFREKLNYFTMSYVVIVVIFWRFKRNNYTWIFFGIKYLRISILYNTRLIITNGASKDLKCVTKFSIILFNWHYKKILCHHFFLMSTTGIMRTVYAKNFGNVLTLSVKLSIFRSFIFHHKENYDNIKHSINVGNYDTA